MARTIRPLSPRNRIAGPIAGKARDRLARPLFSRASSKSRAGAGPPAPPSFPSPWPAPPIGWYLPSKSTLGADASGPSGRAPSPPEGRSGRRAPGGERRHRRRGPGMPGHNRDGHRGRHRARPLARPSRRRVSDGPEIILDGAHNPAGARALAAYIDRFYGHRTVRLISRRHAR